MQDFDIFGPRDLAKLEEISKSIGLAVPENFVALSETFLSELKKWNRRINLVSRLEEPRLIERHLLDSLCLLAVERNLSGKTVVDVGSGAGFPGVVLAAWEPRCRVILVESIGKKVAFLRAARRLLGLANLSVVHSRIEKADEAKLADEAILPESVDLVVARGVRGILELAGKVEGRVKPGGALVLYKGREVARRLASSKYDARAAELGFELKTVTPAWQNRTTLVVLKKTSRKH